METLAFIHTAVAHEDPTPDPEVTAFENLDLKASGTLAMGLVAAGVVATTLSHTDPAQATIYYGQRGSGVTALQSALGVTRDGIFGPQTLSALRTFQSNKGLAVDGVAGPATLPELGLLAGLRADGSRGGYQPDVSGQFGSTYVTARSGLIVRNAPAGYAIGSRGYGSRVGLTGAEQYAGSRNWSQLASGGWVASAYLSSGGGGNGGTIPIGSGSYAAAGSGLLVRSGPAGYVIGGLGYGSPVSLTGATQYANGRSWSQLTSGGWVATDYVSYR